MFDNQNLFTDYYKKMKTEQLQFLLYILLEHDDDCNNKDNVLKPASKPKWWPYDVSITCPFLLNNFKEDEKTKEFLLNLFQLYYKFHGESEWFRRVRKLASIYGSEKWQIIKNTNFVANLLNIKKPFDEFIQQLSCEERNDSTEMFVNNQNEEGKKGKQRISLPIEELQAFMPKVSIEICDIVKYGYQPNKEAFLLTLDLIKTNVLPEMDFTASKRKLRNAKIDLEYSSIKLKQKLNNCILNFSDGNKNNKQNEIKNDDAKQNGPQINHKPIKFEAIKKTPIVVIEKLAGSNKDNKKRNLEEVKTAAEGRKENILPKNASTENGSGENYVTPAKKVRFEQDFEKNIEQKKKLRSANIKEILIEQNNKSEVFKNINISSDIPNKTKNIATAPEPLSISRCGIVSDKLPLKSIEKFKNISPTPNSKNISSSVKQQVIKDLFTPINKTATRLQTEKQMQLLKQKCKPCFVKLIKESLKPIQIKTVDSKILAINENAKMKLRSSLSKASEKQIMKKTSNSENA